MTTNSTTAAASAAVTATSSKRLSGLVSGLDTDSIVQQLTSGTQAKIDKQTQNKQISQWQQQSYREVIKALSEFQSKYLSSATSSSSILNAAFFNSTSINNTSSFLNVSGSSSVAKNMQISSISQLAQQASFSSSHKVSDGKITSGKIESDWTQNIIAGDSVTVTYNGKDYAIALPGDLNYETTDDLSTVTDALNESIAKISDLSGKVKFSVDAGNVQLNTTGGQTATVTIKDGTDELLAGLGLAKGTSVSTTTDSGNIVEASMTGTSNTAYFFNNTLSGNSSLDFTIGSNSYTLTLGNEVKFPVGNSAASNASLLKTALDRAINSNPDLKDKLSVDVDTSTGNVTFTAKDGTSTVDITDGSQNLLQGLGLTSDGTNSYTTSGTMDTSKMVKTYLEDSLAGSTLTFSFNGLTKNISFDEADKASYSTPEGMVSYLNNKLKSAYGLFSDDTGVNPNGYGKVSVKMEADGSVSFFAINSLDGDGKVQSVEGTDVLTVASSDKSGVLGINGALHMYAGSSNRINTNKTLEDVSSDLSTALTPSSDGTYSIKINDKEFTFKSTDTLTAVMNTINNDADANVTMTYSNTTNTFSVVAKNGGASSKVSISDEQGNLAAALFGTAGTDYTVNSGKDAKMTISFDGGISSQEITRSDNNFTLDGVNFELVKTTDSTVNSENPITFTVQNKTDDLMTKIKDFITDYNNIIKLVNGKVDEKKSSDGTYLPLTDAQRKEMSESQITSWETEAKKGLLQNDSLLSSLSLDMRLSMTDQVASIKTALYQIGIATQDYDDNGVLTIDETKLQDALTNNPDKVQELFTSPDGIGTKLQSMIKKYANSSLVDTGLLVVKAGSDDSKVDNSTLAQSMQDNDKKIADLKTELETEQNQYYDKFTKLEQYLSQMNSQMSWFSSNSSTSS